MVKLPWNICLRHNDYGITKGNFGFFQIWGLAYGVRPIPKSFAYMGSGPNLSYYYLSILTYEVQTFQISRRICVGHMSDTDIPWTLLDTSDGPLGVSIFFIIFFVSSDTLETLHRHEYPSFEHACSHTCPWPYPWLFF